MKILLIGPGSIGRRHLGNILQLGFRQIEVVSRNVSLSKPFDHLPVHASVEDALAASTFDAAILCTPTAYHAAVIIQLLKAKIGKIYIEKPVSHSLEHIETIVQLASAYPNKIVVGFDLHFDPGLQKVKELISANTIGKIVSVNAQVGQYLPDWRPAEDYRNGMSSKKQTGGGVMLDLVHEFDYLLWLCGPVANIACMYNHSGALQIETEDVAEVLLQFNCRAIGTIHLDYLQPKLVRNCLVTGEKGSIQWNLALSSVTWANHQQNENSFSYAGFERNDRFLNIMKCFLDNENDERLTSLHKGIESLLLVAAAKYSSESNQFINLSSFSKKS